MTDPVLTCDEVARELGNGTTRQTVAGWCRRGELKGSKHGRAWFIRRSWLEEFLAPTNVRDDVA